MRTFKKIGSAIFEWLLCSGKYPKPRDVDNFWKGRK